MYFHTHVHTEYSILDGMSRIPDLVQKAKQHKQKALAITDHGKLAGVPELIRECKEHDIRPIIGQEFYIAGEDAKDRNNSNSHLVMLALNDRGYHILSELSSMASLPENFYSYPRIDYKMLREYNKDMENVVAYTSCLNGEIPKAIVNGEISKAKQVLKIYRNIFPNLFFELQSHSFSDSMDHREIEFHSLENKLNKTLIKWSDRYKVPIVITNDSHHTEEEQAEAHDILLGIQTGALISDEDRFSFSGTGYHFRSTKEMQRLFSKNVYAKSSKGLSWIYNNADIKLPEFTDHKFYIPTAGYKDPIKKVRSICMRNLKKRVAKKDWAKYKKQLDYELSVVDESNFADEFLIVYDYVNWARDNGISISSGRGSMAGVLISYLMLITDVDPIRFGLSFERAINPARPSLPDFDVDFDDKDRVIEYVKEKYGEENVMKIGTFNRMNPRSLLNSVLRTKGYNFRDSIRYTKQLPDTFEIVGGKASKDLTETLGSVSPDLEELFQKDPEIPELMLEYNGLVKSMGSHAGGVIISDGSTRLRDFIPGVRVREDTELVSQFDKKDVEKIGFIKFDILGLTTLELIRGTLDLIGKDIFEYFPDGDEMEDKKTYDLINNQLLTYIFQLDGGANRNAIKEIGGLHSFEDIVSISSLVRPGTAQFIPQFTENKEDPTQIRYPTKRLRPILNRSNGVILYQEQVMQIAKDLAGFDMVQVDDIKEMIKGKDRKKFTAMKPMFMSGCKKNKLSAKRSEAVWSMIENASGYLYNRAHAVSYSIITYITAYLKANYPLQFFTAALNMSDDKKKIGLRQDAQRMGIEFLPPDINKSDVNCVIEGDAIRIGLSFIKGIGDKTATTFVKYRNEHGLKSAMGTLPKRVVGKVMQKALTEAGAYGIEHTTYTLQTARLGFSTISEFTKKQIKAIEKFWDESDDVKWVCIGGVVESAREIKTKNGDPMAFVDISYKGDKNTLVIFPNPVSYTHLTLPTIYSV